jgi:antitoxin VapB
MALNIKDRKTEEVVRRLAERTGQSITEAVREAAEEKLQAIESGKANRKAALRAFIERARRAQSRSPDR